MITGTRKICSKLSDKFHFNSIFGQDDPYEFSETNESDSRYSKDTDDDFNDKDYEPGSDDEDGSEGDHDSDGDERASKSDDESDEDKSKMIVQKSSNYTDRSGKYVRKWDKKNACKYCSYCGTGKLDKHLVKKHPNEEDVKQLINVMKDSKIKLVTEEQIAADKDRKKRKTELMETLRNEGIYKYNISLLNSNEDKKEFLVKRRQKVEVTIDKHLPCPHCKAFYSRSQIAAHIKNKHGYLSGRNIQQKIAATLPCCTKEVSPDFQLKILDSFQLGAVRNMVRCDDLIIARGMRIFKVRDFEEHPKALDHVREKMRELARLVMEAQKLDPKIRRLEDLFQSKHYDLIVAATKKLCVYDEKTCIFKKPTLAKNIGHAINTCIEILKGVYSRGEDQEKLNSLAFFENVMKEWSSDIARPALKTINRKRQDRPQAFPLAKDIQKFMKFLKLQENEAKLVLEEDPASPEGYKLLSRSLLLQITLFNRRRPGEVERVKLERYEKMKENEPHEDVLACLSPMEKHLLEILFILKTPGKGDRMVPILLTRRLQDGLKVMCAVRKKLPQFQNNQFLFAAQNADGFLDATTAFRNASQEAELEKPENVRALNLRRHVGTMAQILNLGKDGLKLLSKLMSHTERVHNQFYELPEDTLLLTKASKVLFAIDKGIHKYKGKSLDEIEIVTDEELESTDDEDAPTSSGSKNKEEKTDTAMQECEEEGEESPVKPKRKRIKRGQKKKQWSEQEKSKLKKFFRVELLSEQWPKMQKCEEFVKINKIEGRTWRNVKDCVSNIIKQRRAGKP